MEEKEDSLRASVTEQDTEALLLRDVLINGILAIGTLGHNVNSLCPESCIEQYEPIIMCDEKVEQEKCEEEKAEAKQDTPVTAPSEPASALEPAKMHSSSMKEDNFMCFVKEEILMHGMEVEDVPNIQERPLLMLEKVEKVRTTLADLFAAEAFSSSDAEDKCYPKIVIVAGASTSKPTSCMEKMHHKKPTKPTSKPLKATRKLSRVWFSSSLLYLLSLVTLYFTSLEFITLCSMVSAPHLTHMFYHIATTGVSIMHLASL